MSIVSHRASKPNSLSSESLTNHTQASVDVIDRPADRSTAPRTALGSSITEIQSPSVPREYVSGYAQLSKHEVGFYPIHLDKSPAIKGTLNRELPLIESRSDFGPSMVITTVLRCGFGGTLA
jgi:hypothetical protein